MQSINEFIRPTPKPWLMTLLSPINRLLLLKGIPIIRDIPGLNKVPGFRGLTYIRNIDFPKIEQKKLTQISSKNNATFLLPNHPEFFTDWMIDKYLLSKVAPISASWASGDIVNDMGKLMQKFWLNNNLIAQISGQSKLAKEYSVNSAVCGDGVLLHPEGQVGWYSNHVAPLFSGAAEMAIDAYQKGQSTSQNFKSWLAPIVWKLRFNCDVRTQLLKECDYVEDKLSIQQDVNNCPAQRAYQIYLQLCKRDYYQMVDSRDFFEDVHLATLRERILIKVQLRLDSLINIHRGNHEFNLKQISNWFHKNKDSESFGEIRNLAEIYRRWLRLKRCSFKSADISQEEIAEHLKRIRAEFCTGSFRDSVNKYLPQAVGPRTAHIRTVEPFAIHDLIQNNEDTCAVSIMNRVRVAMQNKLDELNLELDHSYKQTKMINPFFTRTMC